MPAERIGMRDAREIIRLKLELASRNSEQVDKWIFCLTPARLAEDQELR